MYMSQALSLVVVVVIILVLEVVVIVVIVGQDGGHSDRGGHSVCDGSGKYVT